MMDIFGKAAGDAASQALLQQLRTLYRARPFTKAVPFSVTIADALTELWSPTNAYFELSAMIVRSDTAGLDLALVDTTEAQPFLFFMPPTTIYQTFDISPGYRSLLYSQARVQLWDPTVSGAVVKGVLYGWEVTQEGWYR
jgi:hypothetical protein